MTHRYEDSRTLYQGFLRGVKVSSKLWHYCMAIGLAAMKLYACMGTASAGEKYLILHPTN